MSCCHPTTPTRPHFPPPSPRGKTGPTIWPTSFISIRSIQQTHLLILSVQGVVWSSITSLQCGMRPAKFTSLILVEGWPKNRLKTSRLNIEGSRSVKGCVTAIKTACNWSKFNMYLIKLLIAGYAIWQDWQQCLHLGFPISIHCCSSVCCGSCQRHSEAQVIWILNSKKNQDFHDHSTRLCVVRDDDDLSIYVLTGAKEILAIPKLNILILSSNVVVYSSCWYQKLYTYVLLLLLEIQRVLLCLVRWKYPLKDQISLNGVVQRQFKTKY